ncbi:MAG: 3-deoxy-D-manno-octulosonic acid transferase, partial [Saprospiraceae bacterium]|nr:3-deoxy-D-manno-octulosonic acid transferase [Saprospiraceae bacterium]
MDGLGLQLQIWAYNLITKSYFIGIWIAGFWSEKAKKWQKGRVGQWSRLEAVFAKQSIDNQQVIWMHCASLGEFEQGRPVLDALRTKYPNHKLLLTFFSPSGFEIRKDYPVVDWVFYLPPDSANNVRRFLDLVKPSLAIFVKYEFWFHYLSKLKEKSIPTILISSIFRPSQPFFKWYGGLHRTMLTCFQGILVQD